MQFRQLRYFVKIVDAGSFSRAASVVHVAQPALSQQIAELEERLGVMLLQRSARGVRPTAAGEILYKEASAILHQLDQLPSAIRPSSGEPEGTVSLGFVSSLAAKWSRNPRCLHPGRATQHYGDDGAVIDASRKKLEDASFSGNGRILA